MKVSAYQKIALLAAAVMLIAVNCAAQSEASAKVFCRPPRLSTHEDGVMFGRILAAIEDLGGGYYKEAKGRYSKIVRDVEKKAYHPCLRWMAYDGYGETLTALKEKDKALEMLGRAVDLAKNLGKEEQDESAKHLEAARNLK
jgi:tetratricopeptide (TPR) repeat protein